MKLNHRKAIFLVIMALLSGSSIALYGTMEGDFFSKTMAIVLLQQVMGAAIYLGCFGTDQTRAPFE